MLPWEEGVEAASGGGILSMEWPWPAKAVKESSTEGNAPTPEGIGKGDLGEAMPSNHGL